MYKFQVQFPTQCQCSWAQPSALSTARSKDFSEYAALCSSETESLGTFEVLASLFALPCRLPSQSRPTTFLHPALTQHFHFTQISLPKHLASNPAKPDTESDYSINSGKLWLLNSSHKKQRTLRLWHYRQPNHLLLIQNHCNFKLETHKRERNRPTLPIPKCRPKNVQRAPMPQHLYWASFWA